MIRESLGPIADELIRLKRDEWREYHSQVESWEIPRYLDRTLIAVPPALPRNRLDEIMEHIEAKHVIIGAGAMGAAAAYQLARRGEPLLLIEQFALGHDRGSSHGAARITRHSYADSRYAG